MVLQLLEWSPTVVASEEVVEEIVDIGHKVDIAIVASSAVTRWSDFLQIQKPVEVVGLNNDNFVLKAISSLKMRNHRAINIITSNTQLFELISILITHKEAVDTVIFTEDQKHILCKSMVFKKWLPDFSMLSVMPLQDKTFVKTNGFDHDLDNEYLPEGISLHRKMEGEITIKATKVPFLISETLV